MRKRICTVIVNYNTAGLTRDCLETLIPQLDVTRDRVMIVDNCSSDSDLTCLRGFVKELNCQNYVDVLALPYNGGFSAGNNAGIKACDADYHLLTNSDTLFRPGAIDALLDAAATFPAAGIISPGLEWPDGESQVSCFRFHSPFAELIRSADTGIVTGIFNSFSVPLPPLQNPSFPGWTSFACVLIRREAIISAGYLDDGFFMYYEDEDFCRRVKRAGFRILNWPDSRVVHLQGKSSDTDERIKNKKKLPDYSYHSRTRYYMKYYGATGFFCANICWIFGRAISLFRQMLGNMECPVPEKEFYNIWKNR